MRPTATGGASSVGRSKNNMAGKVIFNMNGWGNEGEGHIRYEEMGREG